MDKRRLLTQVWIRICYIGEGNYILDLEAFALGRLLASLPEEDQAAFSQQLSRLDFAQRCPDQTIVALHQYSDTSFKKWGDILITNREKYKKLYSMTVKVHGIEVAMDIYVHRGRVASFEYPGATLKPREHRKVKFYDNLIDSIKTLPDFEFVKEELFL